MLNNKKEGFNKKDHENDDVSIVDEFKSFIWHLKNFKDERKKQFEIKKLERASRPRKDLKKTIKQTFKQWVDSLLSVPELMAWYTWRLKDTWKKVINAWVQWAKLRKKLIASKIEWVKVWAKEKTNLFKQRVNSFLKVPELKSWNSNTKLLWKEDPWKDVSTNTSFAQGWLEKVKSFIDKFIKAKSENSDNSNVKFAENITIDSEKNMDDRKLDDKSDQKSKLVREVESSDNDSIWKETEQELPVKESKIIGNLKEQENIEDVSSAINNNNVQKVRSKKSDSNIFSEMWRDIFHWIIEEKDKEIKWRKLSIEHDKDSEVKMWGSKETVYMSFLNLFNSLMPYALIVFINISIWVYIFFEILLDKENIYLSIFNVNNLWAQIYSSEGSLSQKRLRLDSLKRQIDRDLVDIPWRIYYKSLNYKKLTDDIKDKLSLYYNDKTWMIKIWKNKKLTDDLRDLFKTEQSLANLKLYFEKEHVLNSIIEEKIYWKEVYKDLQEATTNTFKYNEILDYITYNNFSVDEDWKISVSWLVTDPSWKVFNQLINLVNTINDHDSFHWASIATFSKTINSNKEVWWMVSPLNLSFYYQSNNE